MSGGESHVLFDLDDQRYAAPSEDVVEIVPLPELTTVPGSRPPLAGLFDLRGRIVSVLDLAAWLGKARRPYRTADSVVVIETGCGLCGIVANELVDVRSIPRETRTAAGIEQSDSALIVAGAQVDRAMVLFLDKGRLLQFAKGACGKAGLPSETASDADEGRSFYWNIPLEAHSLFRQRAVALMQKDDIEGSDGLPEFAVVGLSGEYFGLPLECVREVAASGPVTRVPCCPAFVLGNVNLRGEVLTIVDVRPVLKMPAPKAEPQKIVVAVHGDIAVGIGVDEVYETVRLDLSGTPARPLAAQSGGARYIRGTAGYGDRVLSVLDLPQLLSSGILVVNEEVEDAYPNRSDHRTL